MNELREIDIVDSDVSQPDVAAPEQIKSLAEALAIARMGWPQIPKSRKVTVRTKSGGTYDFAYAPLDVILARTQAHLALYGLSVAQDVEWVDMGRPSGARTAVVTTTILHKSGQLMTLAPFPVLAPDGANPQEWGSALTYARRNSYCTALMIAAEEDEDGNLGSHNSATVTRDTQAADPDVVLAMRKCKTMSQLADVWLALPEKARMNLGNAEIKDQMKEELKGE